MSCTSTRTQIPTALCLSLCITGRCKILQWGSSSPTRVTSTPLPQVPRGWEDVGTQGRTAVCLHWDSANALQLPTGKFYSSFLPCCVFIGYCEIQQTSRYLDFITSSSNIWWQKLCTIHGAKSESGQMPRLRAGLWPWDKQLGRRKANALLGRRKAKTESTWWLLNASAEWSPLTSISVLDICIASYCFWWKYTAVLELIFLHSHNKFLPQFLPLRPFLLLHKILQLLYCLHLP